MMEGKLQILKAAHEGRSFRIEEDKPGIGWYLYVSEEGRCTHDHLQDTLVRAKAKARSQYGVPEDAWIEEKP